MLIGAGSIQQEEEEDCLTCIQADDGGLVLGSKRVGDDSRRNRLEDENRQRGTNDMMFMVLTEVEGVLVGGQEVLWSWLSL